MPPAFSVFIPIFNEAEWLSGAIESILAQTCPDWELVIGDNASEQNLQTIAQRYADPRIRYHRWSTHTDLPENFNRTASLCTGEWVHQLGADDRLVPDCLEIMQARLDQASGTAPRVAMVVSACQRVRPDGQSADREYYSHQPIISVPDGRYDASGWLTVNTAPGQFPWIIGGYAIAREVLAEMGGFFRAEIGLCADTELALRVAAYGDVVYIEQPLLLYMVRSNSGTSRFARRNLERRDDLEPIGIAWRSALAVHEWHREVSQTERAAVRAAISRGQLQRAVTQRLDPSGHGLPGAIEDVYRAIAYSPQTVLQPKRLALALSAVLAPRAMLEFAKTAAERQRWDADHPNPVTAVLGELKGSLRKARRRRLENGARG